MGGPGLTALKISGRVSSRTVTSKKLGPRKKDLAEGTIQVVK